MEIHTYGEQLANIALKTKAIKVNSKQPFQWASGYHMPIYNDNRLLLANPQHRKFIAEGFDYLIGLHNIPLEVIAGVATAGIPPATTLADHLELPLIYIRDKPKDHGLKNQIEGIPADQDLGWRKVVVIEDLISTGGSSVKAVNAVRNANGQVSHLFSIFEYGLDEAERQFKSIECSADSILAYEDLLSVGKGTGYFNADEIHTLEEWRNDPFGWGAKHGFPKVER